MSRYFLELSYNGTRYCGWQIQPNGITVQAEIEDALSTVLRRRVSVVGAGRTDAGVHARRMAAHFDSEVPIEEGDSVIRRLNHLLPNDIAIRSLRLVADEAHARFDATFRRYEYHIVTSKDPFLREFAWNCPSILDLDAMSQAAPILMEYVDFTSFSKLHTDVKTNNCKIMSANWSQQDGRLVFTIQADRFLRNMVRAIVGTMIEVGRGKLDAIGFRRIIEAQSRSLAGVSVPPQGLFLVEVGYPGSIFTAI